MRDIVSFFVTFEHAIIQQAPPGVMEQKKRDPAKIVEVFQIYSGCQYNVSEIDFSKDIDAHEDSQGGRPDEIRSLVLNKGKVADIIINAMMLSDGVTPLVNHCYRRFLTLKEAYHVVLRDEFTRTGRDHPDTARPERLVTLIERLTYLPFSIVDFDSTDYLDDLKVEHAAELLAFLTLYPLPILARDRDTFLANAADAVIITSNTRPFAEEFKVPQRYVDLLFRWEKFDTLYSMYKQFADGFSI